MAFIELQNVCMPLSNLDYAYKNADVSGIEESTIN